MIENLLRLPSLSTIWGRKKGFVVVVSLLAYTGLLIQKDAEIQNLSQTISQRDSVIETLKVELAKTDNKLKALGVETKDTPPLQSVEDFRRDWDTSDFYIVGDDIFCPKGKGGNNYQRMFYKYDTPLTATGFGLKFQMIDQNKGIIDYAQKLVAGIKRDGLLHSEYQLPTRPANGQVINFLVASESGKLVPGSNGRGFSPPIKEGAIVDLKFQTRLNHGQEITQVMEWSYLSEFQEYGLQKKSISNNIRVNDPRPETVRVNLFIGSYIGGCIRIIDWSANWL